MAALQSDEDLKLKEELEMLVTRILETDIALRNTALDAIGTHIRESIGTMTSIPKPLKFLKAHYPSLKEAHAASMDDNKVGAVIPF